MEMPKKITPEFELKAYKRAEGADAEVQRSTRSTRSTRVARAARAARSTRSTRKAL
jgi:hypothetical protein